MSEFALNVRSVFESQRCINCGVEFAVLSDFDQQRRSDRRSFYCPNGHPQAYVESEADRLRKQLALKDAELSRAREAMIFASRRLESEQRSHSATKGQMTKIKSRTSAGICPCCRRNFVSLGRHLRSQHPEYAKDKTH